MQKSFTLIELIVVIAIIAILAAIIAPNAFKAIEKAKITETIGDFKAVKTSIYSLYADTGKWGIENHIHTTSPTGFLVFIDHPNPTPYDARFSELVNDPNNDSDPNNDMSGWDGPYIEKLKGKTPWKNSYAIQSHDCEKGPAREIWFDFEDWCYNPADGGNGACPISSSVATKIDQALDDGNLTSSNFRNCPNWCGCSNEEYSAVIA
ncbi:MAG: prepilin-type N-terminal cleavage/methylation domain-containing protein [Candidatus Omnitrophica bacterium]|nr:prepilin-type N-terminal cleavage/methylation domain-containing protein [Candidatus Omnitrophota bacterium]